MKKVSLLKNAFLVGAMVALASCGNDESIDPASGQNISDPTAVVNALNISKIVSFGDEYTFTYDGGKLVKANEFYSYTDEWGTYEDKSDYEFIYANDKLNSIVRTNVYTQSPNEGEPYVNRGKRTTTFEYNDKNQVVSKKIDRIMYYENETDAYSYSVTLEYDAENRLIKENWLDDGEVDEYGAFAWSGLNVAKQQYFEVENADSGARKKARQVNRKKAGIISRLTGGETLDEEIVFSDYDDKVNPLAILSLIEDEAFGVYISKNNPGKVTYFEDNDGTFEQDGEVTIKHTYDSEGRPTRFTINEGGSEDGEIVITYID